MEREQRAVLAREFSAEVCGNLWCEHFGELVHRALFVKPDGRRPVGIDDAAAGERARVFHNRREHPFARGKVAAIFAIDIHPVGGLFHAGHHPARGDSECEEQESARRDKPPAHEHHAHAEGANHEDGREHAFVERNVAVGKEARRAHEAEVGDFGDGERAEQSLRTHR